jgi:CBS domain-containing protein
MQKYNFLPEVPDFGSEARQTKTWKEATVRDLHLPAVVSVTETSPCGEAVAKMQKGGFDQLPVVNDKGTLRGLVTLGTLPPFYCETDYRKSIILHFLRQSNRQISSI